MILASSSPRRKEILSKIFNNLSIKTKDIKEISDKKTIIDQIEDIAFKKCIAVATENPNEYVLAADTVVVLEDEIITKPNSKKEAKDILKRLSNHEHIVITAYSFLNKNKNIKIINHDITKVYMREISELDIDWYINSKEPLDKAGAYGIQEKGSIFVKKIEGDFFNVMGFPLSKFIYDLRENNIKITDLENNLAK
ncbi:MAG: Maf family protein [Fusobacteriota bacterium]